MAIGEAPARQRSSGRGNAGALHMRVEGYVVAAGSEGLGCMPRAM